MVTGVNFITHLDTLVLQIDISGSLSNEETKEVFAKAYRLVKLYRRDNKLNVLYDLGNQKLTKEIVSFAIPKFMEMKTKIRKRAFVLKNDDQKNFVELFVKTLKVPQNTAVFNDILKALAWITLKEEDVPKIFVKKEPDDEYYNNFDLLYEPQIEDQNLKDFENDTKIPAEEELFDMSAFDF